MRSELTDDEIGAYQGQGFVVLADFLDGSELETWRAVTERAAAARLERSDGLSNAGTTAYYEQVFTQVSGLLRVDDEMAALLLDSRIGRVASQLAGVARVRLWNDQALFKPAFGNPTAYHLDLPYWSFSDARGLTLWVALDDATVENGCMWYLEGSHRIPRTRVSNLVAGVGALLDDYPELRTCPARPAEVPAGGAVWHNACIAHGAGANMTNRPRRAMTCAYMPDGATFNGVIDDFVYPPDVAAGMRVGDVLDDERFNPLVVC